MELMTEEKKGFKKTDVGLIPEDWDVNELNDVIEKIKGGGTPSRSESKYWGKELPWVTVKDFTTFDPNKTQEYITKEGLKSSATNLIPKGTLITSTRMALGKAVIYNVDVTINQDLKALFPITGKIDTLFFYYWFQFNGYKIEELGSGSTVKGISLGDLRKLKIPLPPTFEEQQAIASALSDVDELISSLDGLIQKKQAIKKGAMQQLLTGKKRLPGFDGEWEVKRLEECLIKFQNGNAFSAKGYVDEGVPIVSMAQIGLDGEFNFDISKVNKWPKSEYSRLSDFHLKSGDIIMSMTDVTPQRNLIGRMAMVKSNHQLLLNQRVGLLKLDYDKINPVFLKSLSNLESWREYFKAVSSLGVQANISTKQIKNAEIRLPSIQEQNAIAQILSDMDRELQTLRQKREKYVQIKQGMMQELLTGKTRLV